MAKKRIHQIAKELDIASADILFHAKELGIEVKTASSGLTEEEEQLVKLSLFPESESESEKVEEISESKDEIPESQETDNNDISQDDAVSIVEITKNSTPNQISNIIDIDALVIVQSFIGLVLASKTVKVSNSCFAKPTNQSNQPLQPSQPYHPSLDQTNPTNQPTMGLTDKTLTSRTRFFRMPPVEPKLNLSWLKLPVRML